MHHHCVHGAKLGERAGENRYAIIISNADDLARSAGGICEWTNDVHYSRNAELTTDWTDVPHCRMHHRRVHDYDPSLRESGYHRRSLAETAMSRMKTIFGGTIASRKPGQQAKEVGIRCRALNIMTHQGMPVSERVVA